MTTDYHIPVMLPQVIEGLNIQPEGRYVDVTYGGGGHSQAILEHLSSGRLVAFDQDFDAGQNVIGDDRLLFIDHNFQYLKNFLKFYDLIPVHGILADLGVSSHQIDEATRGFSFRFDAGLDMRMDRDNPLTAADLLNTYPEEKLVEIFSLYGELPKSKSLARAIADQRRQRKFNQISDLVNLAENFAPAKHRNKYLAQLFQSLRLEINQEMQALESMLVQSADVMATGGRLVVISYHSLEDRMVKNFLNTGNTEGIQNKDEFGNVIRPFKQLTRKPVVADEEELGNNPRARSAKLRIGEKL